MLNNVKTILFNNKYVENVAKDLITDFSKNTYVIKGSTGIGGTTALLNYTAGNCLIISPNIGMIKAKQSGAYASNKQLFIYSNSSDDWASAKDLLLTDSNIIINTTPEQILKIKASDKQLYSVLVTIPIFVDEVHSYTADASYRPALTEFMSAVYNDWVACFKLSTATPNYNFCDIPSDKAISYYKLLRTSEPVKQLYYSERKADLHNFVMSEYAKGRLVVVFSNDKNVHKLYKELNVKNLTGDNLRIKLAPFNRGGVDENALVTDCDVLMLSSSYFAGFDIQVDCSICIVSNQKSDAFKINVNNLVQAYGRCRSVVHNALFINLRAKKDAHGKPITVLNDFSEVTQLLNNHKLTTHNYITNASDTAQLLNRVNDYQLYNRTALNEALSGYNFELSDYQSECDVVVQTSSVPFNKRILTLLNCDSTKLKYDYLTIKRNVTTKSGGTFTPALAIEYLTAFLMRIANNSLADKLNNKRVKPNEFYSSFEQFLKANSRVDHLQNSRVTVKSKSLYESSELKPVLKRFQYLIDDWYMLYAVHKVKNNILPDSIEREIAIYECFYNVTNYVAFQTDANNHRVRDAKNHIIERLTDSGITLRADEVNWLGDVAKSIYKTLDSGNEYTHSNSKKHFKNKMTNAILYLYTRGECELYDEVKGRVYTPLTQLPRAMRCILPLKYISVDLTSANAQIVDNILDTNIALSVYANLMQKRNITRQQAKVLYNSSLNNHYQSVKKAYEVYSDAGYTDTDAMRLARLTARVDKGSFYELMTASEKTLMQNYQNILPIKTYRFHDSIVMRYDEVTDLNLTLCTKLESYVYHVEVFNDSDAYTGRLSDENYCVSNGVLSNEFYM